MSSLQDSHLTPTKLEKKRKNIEGAKDSKSPIHKIRSATLTRQATSKLQFVVDLGTSMAKGSPSKSTANALSLHSSVPYHNTPAYVQSICNSPSAASSVSSISSPSANKTSEKKKKQNNTLHRRSIRISQQLKLDEVTKIYAPLTGSDYLATAPSTPLSPTLSSSTNTNYYQYNSCNNTPVSHPTNFYPLTPVSNKDQLQNTTTTVKSTPIHCSTPLNENHAATTSSSSLNSSNGSTSISPLMASLSTAAANNDNKENVVNSPPTSPNTGNKDNAAVKHPLSPIRLSLTMSPVLKASARKSVSFTPAQQSSGMTISNQQHQKNQLENNKRETINNCEFILGKMSEYQKIVLSNPTLSKDILHSEYEYLITDTRIISKILSPFNNIQGSETDTEVIIKKEKKDKKDKKDSSSSSLQQQQKQEQQQQKKIIESQQQKLAEMDIIAQSIASIAKKILAMESEVKKPNITEKKTHTLGLYVFAIKQYLEDGQMPSDLPTIPTEVAHSLIQSTESTTKLYQPDENGYVYKSGYLIKKCKKGPLVVWKEQWFVLSCEKLSICSSQSSTKIKKEIALNNIISIAPCTKYTEFKHCFMLNVKNPSIKIIVRATSEREASLWMLAIDGLPRRNFDTNQSCINQYIRETMLEVIGSNGGVLNYRRSIAGGVVRSSHGEEWTYRADGTIFNTDHLEPSIRAKELKYVWNGQLLVAAKDSPRNLGSGKFNGVWLAWYDSNGDPFLKYIWDPESNEYLNQNSNLSHKWSTRGLVSKVGTGEWMIEGNVPPTIVMFLQCLRYCRLGKDF
ncbi:hypothetical protein DFA_01548 [Cavenderia fasciculata]|uniref:PH domain-containing protein n=1 Tax=Cavenderia fasciculata TaxID=261658 RepID=F4PTE0_CACFS|nr:uncharacterized protein DFA_01548 [Cavenderia fasciculata]EGG21662.1 hypothetical protein DFA_01548 [Cavenderia fasciculata]|eukprot:XP_004359512.1 hypothetical protein DFA_01548 [Cavenderia fasciculata]